MAAVRLRGAVALLAGLILWALFLVLCRLYARKIWTMELDGGREQDASFVRFVCGLGLVIYAFVALAATIQHLGVMLGLVWPEAAFALRLLP